MELECQLELARAYGILTSDQWRRLSDEVSLVRRMIWSLRAKILAAPDQTNNRN